MKEYWTDETGVAHKILYNGVGYIVLDGDEEVWLDKEDVYDEEDWEREAEEEAAGDYDDDLRTYHSLSLWGANGYNW